MKKYSAVIVLVIALALGTAAVFLANKWLTSRASTSPAVVKESVPMTKIVVAASDILPGVKLSGDNLTLTSWPKDSIPKGAFEKIDDLQDRVALSKLSAGQPLVAAELAAPGSGAGLVALIDPGKRAMAIRVNEEIGVAGFIFPNSYVDVIGIREVGKHRKVAETILKKIRVLAVAQQTSTEDGKAKLVKTVTLEVKPEEAEKLTLQTTLGPIHLVLRNPLEKETPKPIVKKVAVRRTIRTLHPRVYRPQPPEFEMELIQGDKPPEKFHFKAAAQ